MESAARTASVETMDDMSTFTIVMCETDPDPEVQALAAPVKEERERLREVARGKTAAREAFTRTRAGVIRATNHLLDVVRGFYHNVLIKCQNDLGSPTCRAYFPNGIMAVTRSRPEVEIERVSEIANALDSEQDPDLRAHLDPMRTALKGLEEALISHRQAKIALKTAGSTIAVERIEWDRTYHECHDKLRAHFRNDRRIADRYFPPSPRRRGAMTEDEEDGEATAGGGTTSPGQPAPGPGNGPATA